MKAAMEPVLQKVVACREDFDVEDRLVLVFTFHFAQVWGLAVLQQLLEEPLPVGAPDFGLEVSAAGCLLAVVRRATWRRGARVGIRDHRMKGERTLGGWCGCQVPLHHLALVHQLKQVATHAPRLLRTNGGRDRSTEAVRLAPGGAVGAVLQVATRDMNPRIRPELIVLDSQRTKIDPLRMSEEPCAVVVFLSLEDCNAKLHIESAALPTEPPTRRSVHRV
jgi:hypothetical protein